MRISDWSSDVCSSDLPSLRATGTIVEVDHPERGKYLTVGNPIKLSDSPADGKRSPLLGEHTEEILRDVLGYSEEQVQETWESGALGNPERAADEGPKGVAPGSEGGTPIRE